jgi:hypothetical protein
MKKRIVALLFLPALSFAQSGIDNLWLMGYASFGGPPFRGINIDFNSGSAIVSYESRPMNFSDISVTICDKNGNVLFYTNGAYIANADDDTMQNG